jgi:glycosyltransferase involved in cell wall biosynthesis
MPTTRSPSTTVEALLRDPGEAERLGRNGRARAVEEFLGGRHLQQYARLFGTLAERGGARAATTAGGGD